MNGFFGHIDAAPLFYGLLLAIGIFSMLRKLLKFDLGTLAVEVIVFYVVFSMHKGTLTGGMSAAICALIVGLAFKLVVRWSK
ncbi:hypothetical protein [Rhodoferax fermentans]|uniref:Uncharacterized protein n=1 Tax=Rhodoferax fermentans TaxID=28066 RepID=A0A1T1AP12_RHOFE|nr:hypothetical protein [Rhodoferax fermentans]OOV05777.1 hypothetical protein RF819_02795 [Rhodoferax fermentans]